MRVADGRVVRRIPSADPREHFSSAPATACGSHDVPPAAASGKAVAGPSLLVSMRSASRALVVAREISLLLLLGGANRGSVRAREVPLSTCAAVALGRGRTARGEEQSRGVTERPRRGHVRAAARCRRPPSLTRHAAGVPRRPAAAQQGDALSRGSADDRGDRDRDAPRRRRRPRPPTARPDRGALARRAADL